MTFAEYLLAKYRTALSTENFKWNSVSKKFYFQIQLSRTQNYSQFKKYWNSRINGKTTNIETSTYNVKFTLGAISKDTKDKLTIYVS